MAVRNVLDKELILFGGKGGVGKTTLAAATAMALVPKKTLLISTDPAHSLGHCLGQQIGDEIVKAETAGDLYALEISAEKTLRQFKQDYRRQLLRLLETSAGIEHLTRRERENLLSLPVPGVDEVMGLKRVTDLIEERAFERYVLDTAPTGHALRLLSMPQIFDEWISTFYDLRRRHRDYEKAFGTLNRADEFLLTLKRNTARVRDLLRSETTEFVVVAAPERLVIEETKELVSRLLSFGIPVRHLITNKLFPEIDADFSRVRRDEEQRLVQEIKHIFGQLAIKEVPLQPTEPRGVDNLRRLASLLYS